MKRLSMTALALMLGSLMLFAQGRFPEYLLDDFQESTVFYKDGRAFSVRINYNFIDKSFLFYDNIDKEMLKQFADITLVASIKVGDRVFNISKRGEAIEMLQFDPLITVEYRARLKPPPKRAAYGGRSETTAIQSYGQFSSGGITHHLEGERMAISDMTYSYTITVNKKKKTFLNMKQFWKIFPDHKNELEKYVAENKVEIDKPESVMQLCNYALSLR